MNKEFQFQNGIQVRDVVTGFVGIITGRVDYLTGCNQYLVQPGVDDKGAMTESRWFDETRLVVVKSSPVILPTQKTERKAGADKPAPRK